MRTRLSIVVAILVAGCATPPATDTTGIVDQEYGTVRHAPASDASAARLPSSSCSDRAVSSCSAQLADLHSTGCEAEVSHLGCAAGNSSRGIVWRPAGERPANDRATCARGGESCPGRSGVAVEQSMRQWSRIAVSKCQVRRISITSYSRARPGGKTG